MNLHVNLFRPQLNHLRAASGHISLLSSRTSGLCSKTACRTKQGQRLSHDYSHGCSSAHRASGFHTASCMIFSLLLWMPPTFCINDKKKNPLSLSLHILTYAPFNHFKLKLRVQAPYIQACFKISGFTP